MENFDNVIIDNTVLSEHPVLTNYKNQIASLEELIQALRTEIADTKQTVITARQEKWKFQERVKNVLIEALDDDNEAIVRQIAENLDIELTKTFTYEVNVTFQIELEIDPLNAENIDPDWDFDFSVSHNDLVDYSSDVVWSKLEEV